MAPIYVDDRLKAADTVNACQAATKGLLKTLGVLGYRVSAKKGSTQPDCGNLPGAHTQGGQKVVVKSNERDHPEDLPT